MSLLWIMKCHFMFVFCYSPIVWCIYLKNYNKIPTFLDSSYFFIMWCTFISDGKTERKQKHEFASWSSSVKPILASSVELLKTHIYLECLCLSVNQCDIKWLSEQPVGNEIQFLVRANLFSSFKMQPVLRVHQWLLPRCKSQESWEPKLCF